MTQPEKNKRRAGFSNMIDLRRLERETRKYLYWGALFAVSSHIALMFLVHYDYPQKTMIPPSETERRIKVDIIVIPPSAPNPYERWEGPERPLRIRPTLQRRPRYVMPGGSPRFKTPQRFEGPVYRFRSEDLGIDVDALIEAVMGGYLREIAREGVRDPEPFRLEPYHELTLERKPSGGLDRISMQEEMLRIEDLDTGKHKGLVILDPGDERSIKGYMYIPSKIFGERMEPPEDAERMVAGLSDIMKRHTGVTVRADLHLTLSSPNIARFPLLLILADDAFDLSAEEQRNIGNYLRKGGFLFLEAYGGDRPDLPPKASGSLKTLLLDALGPEGNLELLPNDHALFHCFFDFDEAPHLERENGSLARQPATKLEGVFLGDRLVAVYSEKGYGREWGRVEGLEAFGRFGVNLVIFALTQANGISLRLVDDSGWK